MSRNDKNGQKRSAGRSDHPMVIGMFIGVLVGLCLALGVALYLNKSSTPFVSKDKAIGTDKTGPLKQGGKTDSAGPVSAVAGKPAEPKPRLDFYTILPGKEEVVPDKDVNRPVVGNSSSRVVYYLQAGAFQAAPDADNLKARLALAGLEAQIQTATLPDNSVWHRVRLGPYSNAQDLEKARAALKENKIDNAVIKVNEPLAKR